MNSPLKIKTKGTYEIGVIPFLLSDKIKIKLREVILFLNEVPDLRL